MAYDGEFGGYLFRAWPVAGDFLVRFDLELGTGADGSAQATFYLGTEPGLPGILTAKALDEARNTGLFLHCRAEGVILVTDPQLGSQGRAGALFEQTTDAAHWELKRTGATLSVTRYADASRALATGHLVAELTAGVTPYSHAHLLGYVRSAYPGPEGYLARVSNMFLQNSI